MVAGHAVTPQEQASGARLKQWWLHGEGAALWVDSPRPWTTLVAQLVEKAHMTQAKAKVVASRWFIEEFGFAAGSDLNRVTHGHAPRGKKVGPG
jgi:hypothetical protein